jgi:hypothetical protein
VFVSFAVSLCPCACNQLRTYEWIFIKSDAIVFVKFVKFLLTSDSNKGKFVRRPTCVSARGNEWARNSPAISAWLRGDSPAT